ncbi:DUF3034 family protein [Halomonas ventosae]|uniref:DUF3034 family protein n=1 Tax=Halomonas ventosae TaxID=229007 RepID=UPI001060F2C9|nr:DUF3034 family protein [Halomonas ventosae]
MSGFQGPLYGGGINPSAEIANPIAKPGEGLNGSSVVGMPQVGLWYVNLSDSDLTWTAESAQMSFFNRFEVGLSHSDVDASKATGEGSVNFNTITAKLQVIQPGQFGALTPAFAVGYMHKDTDNATKIPDAVPGLGGSRLYPDDSGDDYYVALTETFYDNVGLPLPVTLNVGMRWTKGYLMGVDGFGNDWDNPYFASLAIGLPTPKFVPGHMALGAEYADSSDVGEDRLGREMKTSRMYDIALAWLPTPKLTLQAIYLNNGSDNIYDGLEAGQNPIKLGDGFVLSTQYHF